MNAEMLYKNITRISVFCVLLFPIALGVNLQPLSEYNLQKTQQKQQFELDLKSYYSPTETSPEIRHLLFKNESLFVSANGFIFKVDTDGEEYSTNYAIQLDGEKCIFAADSSPCRKKVMMLVDYGPDLLGCYAFNYDSNVFQVSSDTIRNASEPVTSLISSEFCPVDPTIDPLVFTVGDHIYSLASVNNAPMELKRAPLGETSDKVIRNNYDSDRKKVIGSKYIPQAVSYFVHNDSVYTIFKEVAAELNDLEDYKGTVFSRIAKVCIDDKGSGLQHLKTEYWTSFAKARLVCSLPGRPEHFFDEVNDTVFIERTSTLFGVFNTPVTGVQSSAICVYNMDGVLAPFSGRAYDIHEFIPTEQANSQVIKDYNPARCTNRSHDMDPDLIKYMHQNPLMKDAVRPINPEPVFGLQGLRVRLVSITGEPVDTSSGVVYVLYAGTDSGEVLKLATDLETETVFLARYQVFAESVAVRSIKLDSGLVVVSSSSEIVNLKKEECGKRKSCAACMETQDAYCFWDGAKCSEAGGEGTLNAFKERSNITGACPVIANPEEPETSLLPGELVDSTESVPVAVGGGNKGVGENDGDPGSNPEDGGVDINGTMHAGGGLLGMAAAGSEQQQTEEEKGLSTVLTVTLITGVACIIIGIMAGMGGLYCFAFYRSKRNAHSSKCAPNEMIYSPLPMGKSPSSSSEQPDANYLYQQVYAQYLQVDPNVEEKHYSTISSLPRSLGRSISGANMMYGTSPKTIQEMDVFSQSRLDEPMDPAANQMMSSLCRPPALPPNKPMPGSASMTVYDPRTHHNRYNHPATLLLDSASYVQRYRSDPKLAAPRFATDTPMHSTPHPLEHTDPLFIQMAARRNYHTPPNGPSSGSGIYNVPPSATLGHPYPQNESEYGSNIPSRAYLPTQNYHPNFVTPSPYHPGVRGSYYAAPPSGNYAHLPQAAAAALNRSDYHINQPMDDQIPRQRAQPMGRSLHDLSAVQYQPTGARPPPPAPPIRGGVGFNPARDTRRHTVYWDLYYPGGAPQS